jgi:hypothetical protein
MDDIVAGIRTNIWGLNPNIDEVPPTMLSPTEIKMLSWLAGIMPFTRKSCIVDAGCFLGGSTAAFGKGIASNNNVLSKSNRIHCYDMFITPRDTISQGMIGNRLPGTSFIDIFSKNTERWNDFIVAHAGDFCKSLPPGHPIEILFVDIAKTWELNDRIIRSYFPRLVPGKSIIIQQDTNDHSCPWVNITMEYYANYFEILTDDSASRLFLFKNRIPAAELQISLRHDLTFDAKMRLMERSASHSRSPVGHFLCSASAAWIIFESVGITDALSYLDDLSSQQPWDGESYVAGIRSGMLHVGNMEGFSRYISEYFRPR